MHAKYYYEAHVTLDPVGEQRQEVEEMAGRRHFRLAKLLMDKGVPSQLDTFMTGHDKSLDVIKTRLWLLVRDLQNAGFVVRRYKIEDTILDSRIKDELALLSDEKCSCEACLCCPSCSRNECVLLAKPAPEPAQKKAWVTKHGVSKLELGVMTLTVDGAGVSWRWHVMYLTASVTGSAEKRAEAQSQAEDAARMVLSRTLRLLGTP